MSFLFKKKHNTKLQFMITQTNKIEAIFYDTFLHKKFKILSKIGEYHHKCIYLIKSCKKGIKYILKIKYISGNAICEKKICSILKKIHHPNIIKLVVNGGFANCKYADYYYFIYEYFEGVNLHEYFVLQQKLSECEIKNISLQIVNAVKCLHSYNIIHCDLKLDNIVINGDGVIKVIDYDLSILCDGCDDYISDKIFGTMKYIAPESYDLCIYSRKSDIWQIGVMMYIMITSKFPYGGTVSLINSYSNLCRKNIFKHIDFAELKNSIMENEYDVSLFDLLSNMLAFDDSKRISIDEILKSDWFNE